MRDNKQGDLFNITEARAARDEAVTQIASTANPEFMAYMLDRVIDIARIRRELTSDHVFHLAIDRGDMPDVHDRRAFGPVMMAARRAGIVRKTDRLDQCARASRHAAPLRIWESLIYGK